MTLNYEVYATMVDHDAHRLGAWKLVDGKWEEPDDILDPLFNGAVIWGAKPEDYPPLPPERQ